MVGETTAPLANKRSARLAYYEGMRNAAEEQFKLTEDGIRKLECLDPAEVEKIIADLHKRHEKILNRIDGYIQKQTIQSS